METVQKRRYPSAIAKQVARVLCGHLKPHCAMNEEERRPYLVCAGSLRRGRDQVGDLELVYVPHVGEVQDGLFSREADLVEIALQELIETGVLRKRKNGQGTEIWGTKNKLAVHVATNLPVDLFAATSANWYNNLVCRTGGAQSNQRIASQALARGLAWHPYNDGFSVREPHVLLEIMKDRPIHLKRGLLEACEIRMGATIAAGSEEDVFALAGLPYLEPWKRA